MKTDPKINALLSLLQDDNPKVASLAMEQFLKLDQVADETIATYQDCHDPQLRQRIHQMSSIRGRRRARKEFLHGVEESCMSVWDGLRRINRLYDPQCDVDMLSRKIRELRRDAGGNLGNTAQVASYMREQGFAVPQEAMLEVDLYLTDSVLESMYGSSVLLCALAQHLGRHCGGWESTISLYEGRFCLVDAGNVALEPIGGWRITKLEPSRNLHPCSRQDVWMAVLTQLFLVALVEGDLRDLYFFGDLLTALNGDDVEVLPYPLGDEDRPQPQE